LCCEAYVMATLLVLLSAPQAAGLLLGTNTAIAPAFRCRHNRVVARTDDKLKLALDIKGKPIWDLRVAANSDASALSEIAKGMYPEEILSPLVSSGYCIVGESGGQVVSAALVHAFKGLVDKSKGVDGGIEEHADLLSVLAKPGLPAEMRQQTALAALRKLKSKGFSDVICSVATDDKENVEFVKSLGMEETKSSAKDVVTFRGPLLMMNPDPQKKIKE